jgi:phosphatidylinositol alpha-mannosyltransferase
MKDGPLKVCLVSDIYYPHPGGISEHIYHLAQHLRKRGHTGKILTADYGDNKTFTHPDIIRVGRAMPLPSNKSVAMITIGRNLSDEVKGILARERFDVVHIHGSLAPMLPFLALLHSQAANFATFHAAHEDSTGYALFGPILQGYFDRLDGLIAVSPVARDSIARYFPGDYRIIPNGIDLERFHAGIEPLDKFQDGSPTILFVGRLDSRKGIRYLLRAFPYVWERIPRVRLVVAGPGTVRTLYRYLATGPARERILFEGLVPAKDLPRYYASCDVFCSPATGQESFGIVLLEAMACGKALVASDIPGYRCVVTPGEDGMLVPPRNVKRLAVTLSKVLSDKDLRRHLGAKGRLRAEQFAWPKVAEQVEDYYREVIQRRSR